MSVCATCLKPGLTGDQQHDCPGLGDIQLTRQLGRGLRVDTAPARARMALTVLADHGYGLAMQDADLVNIADQVLYQVVGYDPESAALVLELVEDWRNGNAPDEVEDQLRRTRIELEHWQTVIVPELRDERDKVRAILREVLAAFTTARRDDGVIAGHFLEGAIHPDDMAQWRAALDPKGADEPPPGFVPFTPAHIPRRETSTDPMAVEPYRNDRNQDRWVFRCWGTATCEGWLSLDHPSRESAERARSQHVADEHATGEQAVPTSASTCTATIKSYGGPVLHCAQPAGHYDETRQPEPLVDNEPGDWHRSAPDREGNRMTWADWASDATPHGGKAAPTSEEGQSMPTPKRITIDAPNGATILAARHLDATEGPVQVGTMVDAAARSAITTVLRYVARAHNSPAAPAHEQPGADRVRALHVRNPHSGTCEHCSAGDYPDYAVPWPCPTVTALGLPEEG